MPFPVQRVQLPVPATPRYPMPTRTNRLLAAVLCLAVAAPALPTQAADLDKLVPPDTEAVAFVNVRSLVGSAVFKRYFEKEVQAALKAEPVAKFFKDVGFDPVKDLTSATYTFTGGSKNPHGCIIVRGNFTSQVQAAVFTTAKAEGGWLKLSPEGNGKFLVLTRTTSLGQNLTATFVGEDALVLSNDVKYLKVIAAGEKLAPTRDAKTLAKAVAKLGGKETLFLAGAFTQEGKDQLGNIPQAPQLKDIAPKIDAFVWSATVTEAVDLTVSFQTADLATARELAQLANGSIPLLQLAGAADDKAKPVIDLVAENVKIDAEGPAANIRLSLNESLVGRLMKLLNIEESRVKDR